MNRKEEPICSLCGSLVLCILRNHTEAATQIEAVRIVVGWWVYMAPMGGGLSDLAGGGLLQALLTSVQQRGSRVI